MREPEGSYPIPVAAAAELLGCQPGELMAWRILEDPNRVVVIGPTGQKFRFSEAEIIAVSDQRSAISKTAKQQSAVSYQRSAKQRSAKQRSAVSKTAVGGQLSAVSEEAVGGQLSAVSEEAVGGQLSAVSEEAVSEAGDCKVLPGAPAETAIDAGAPKGRPKKHGGK